MKSSEYDALTADAAGTFADNAAADDAAFQSAVSEQKENPPKPAFMDTHAAAISSADLLNRFTYRPLNAEQVHRYDMIRAEGLGFSKMLLQACPRSPEQTLAIRKIEEAVMWASSAIARNE
ncbi:MAG: hypothetical protein ABI822_14760 [Bryobacteraceae bacterium]